MQKTCKHPLTPFGVTGSRSGSAMVQFETAIVASIVTIALSQTIRPQFVVECLRRSNQQGVGHFVANSGEEREGWSM